MKFALPFNLLTWIETHRDSLKPPVCNKELFRDSEFIVMVVGGPNARTDYHDDPGAEIFYQLEGEMLLKIVDDGTHRDIHIGAGEIFLLPPHVHHSPRRRADTVGIVIERQRAASEQDGFIWYCEGCGDKLHDEYLHVADIEKDLPPVFKRFRDNHSDQNCKRCGTAISS